MLYHCNKRLVVSTLLVPSMLQVTDMVRFHGMVLYYSCLRLKYNVDVARAGNLAQSQIVYE